MINQWSEGGNAHFLVLHKNTIGGTGENKTDEQTRTMLGVNSRAEGELCNTLHSYSIYGLTLAWVTSENSTKQLECWLILTQSSSLDPIFSATVSGVDRICPWFHANSSADSPLCCPVANSCQPFVQPTLFHVPLPLPDTAIFQVQKSFVWFRAKTDKGIVCSGHPYSATEGRRRWARQ